MKIFVFIILGLTLLMVHQSSASKTISAYCTSYGWNDNSPPSAQIAYPGTFHQEATEGSGAYNDPITLATDKNEIPVGSRVYVTYLRKYFVMEDDCTECDHDWQSDHKYHVDLWMGPHHHTDNLQACEDKITRNHCTIIVDPPNNLPVDTTPLVNGDGHCSAQMFSLY